MALVAADWQVRTDKSIRYIGTDHGTAAAGYVTVLELHRWLQDLADDASISDDDYMDITTLNPTDKKFDTIITLVNGYTLDDAYATPASEFLFGGSIIQGTGGSEVIYDGVKVVANAGVKVNVIQDEAPIALDFWNSVPDGSKITATATVGTGSTGTTVVLSDTSEFVAGDTIMFASVVDEEYLIDSITDGTDLEVTETLITSPTNGQAVHFSTRGINPDIANGVAMQFMVKIRDAGADIDNRSLIFTTREWFSTYSEFRIPATGRGENTVPLLYAGDLNNTTPIAIVAAWTTIVNVTAGWNQIDVNQDTSDENYYSEWNRDIYDINQFYERMKWLTRGGETTTLYGLPGEEFRGITQAVGLQAAPAPGAWTEGAPITWDSGASSGQVLAYDTTSDIVYIQLTSGVIPGDAVVLTDATNSATTLGSNPVSEKTISAPFCGASTGSSIVGAYGFSLEYADLAVSDKIQALDGITRQPPNNVSFTVFGILSGYRVLVGPEDGAGGLDYDQLSNTALLDGPTVTAVEVDEAIPNNTPTSGTIRILRVDGSYTRHPYSAVSATPTIFTITSHNFSTNNAAIGANIFISYLDLAAGGTSESYNTVQTATQTLFVEARFGGTGPLYTDSIKPAATTGTLGSTGGTATLSPVSDA
jgi:hypothetical protein